MANYPSLSVRECSDGYPRRSPGKTKMDAETLARRLRRSISCVRSRRPKPVPELESWQPDMRVPYEPSPDDRGDFHPGKIRHIRSFERTKDFLQDCYGLAVGPDLFFDCRAMQRQGPSSAEFAPERERIWYIRALRIGVFLFNGEFAIGLSCRSLTCQRTKCSLNLKNKDRSNRVDLYQFPRIFEGEGMPLARAVAEVPKWFEIPLHGFGQAHYPALKQSVCGQIKRHQKNIPALIRNFSNLCKRSALVYFYIKPPTDEDYRDHFFFSQAIIVGGTLVKIS